MPGPPSSAYHRYQESMQALLERVREIDVGTFETAPEEKLSSELQPRTTSLLAQANQIVRGVLDACDVIDLARSSPPPAREAMAPPSVDFEIAIDEAILLGSFSTARIADIAFMAQVELRQRASRLASVPPASTAALIAECDSALRRVTKALCAIDRAIARASDTPAYLDYLSELQISLRVRRAYARFRKQVFSDDTESADIGQSERRLRRAGTEIAVIIGQPVYPTLRLNDRVQLRSLQQRILSWLRPTERDAAEGQHLWRDITAFAAMLKHVDRRQELFEHDARIVFSTLDALSRGEPVTDNRIDELRALVGRDDEVDALVELDKRDVTQWLEVLERLSREIGTRTMSSAP